MTDAITGELVEQGVVERSPYAIQRSWFPDHIVVRAYELLRAGHSNRTVVSKLQAEYPDERIPSKDTVRTWDRVLAEASHEESETREQRIMGMYDDLLAEAAMTMEGNPIAILKHLMSVNAVRGTMADKQFKRRESTAPNVQVNILMQERYNEMKARVEVIEVEAQVVSE